MINLLRNYFGNFGDTGSWITKFSDIEVSHIAQAYSIVLPKYFLSLNEVFFSDI